MCDDLAKHVEELEILVSMIKHDVVNLKDGNKHASVDARKRLSTISKLSSTIRAECLSIAKPKLRGETPLIISPVEIASKEVESKLDVPMSFSPSETERLNSSEPMEDVPPQPESVRQNSTMPVPEEKATKGCPDPVGLVSKSRVRKPKMSRKKPGKATN